MNARRFTLGLLPLAAILLLAACSQPQSGSTITFSMQHDSDAYAVLQNADGSVITTQTLAPGTTTVSFADVPDGALVTAALSETHSGAPAKYAFTAPASLVNGHTIYVIYPYSGRGQTSGQVAVSGACPPGSTPSSTRIYSVVSKRLGSGGVTSSYVLCDASNNFSLTADYYDSGSSGKAQLTFLAEDGSTMSAYLHVQTISPTQTTLTVAPTDWQTTPTSDSSSVTFSPALATNGAAETNWQKFALVDGLREPLALSHSTSTSTVGATSLSLNAELAPVTGATSFLSSFIFHRTNCPSSSSCIQSWVYQDASTNTLPANQSLTIGTDTWPSLQDFSWKASATTSPVVTYASSPGFTNAKLVYADVLTTDSTTGATAEWELVSESSADMSGTVTFPQLPANLQSLIPVPAASGNEAHLAITDVSPDAWWFNALWPNTYNEVDADTTAATTAGLTAGPRTPGAHGPIGGSGLWLR